MKKIVLIIDDNDKVRQALEDRIVSMRFDFDSADCQMAATSLLQKRRYDLILLDQELPIKKGKPTHKQVGRNLLEQIRECENNHATPVIIVTAHDGDNSSVVSDLMLNGASYFIHKPQLEILEEKIRVVLEKQERKAKKTAPNAGSPDIVKADYPGGILSFRSDGVFLDEIRIASKSTVIARILLELGKTTPGGKRRAYSGKELAKLLNLRREEKAVAEPICEFRKDVIDRLKVAGFKADADTVITRGLGGYELAASIQISGVAEMSEEAISVEPGPQERQRWVLDQLQAGRKLTRAQFEKQFDMSSSTSKRDLRMLDDRIEFIGVGKGGYYRMKAMKKGALVRRCVE